MERNYYEVLGVDRNADAAEIKRVYRTLAKKLHPDHNPDDKAAEERFKDVSTAYGVLSNEEQRKLYDRFGEAGLKEGFDVAAYDAYSQRGTRGFDFQDAFSRGGGAGGAGFDFNLEDLFVRRAPRAPRKGSDLESAIRIDFVDAVQGCERELLLGGGAAARKFKARIPAGIGNDDRVRLRGKGNPGSKGGPPGDLLLKVEVNDHPCFDREGSNLLLHLPITPSEAFHGAKVKVPTPTGDVQLKIPKGAQGGQRLRLKGKGIARKGKHGDLIVELQIRLPTVESDEVSEALDVIDAAFENEVRKDLKF